MIRFILFFIIITTTVFSEVKLEKVSIQLNWKYQFEFAGFIAAKEKGFYKDVGLDVDLKEFDVGIDVLDELKDENSTFAIYDASLQHIEDKKRPIKLIANYFKRSALVFIGKQDILTPFDFKDKVFMADAGQLKSSTLNTLLKKFNIKKDDFIFKQHSFNPDDFVSGKVDIMSAYISNELYHIKKSKIPYTIIDPISYGIYGSGLNVFTLEKSIKNNPSLVKKFIEATNKGWIYSLDNKQEVIDIIFNKYSKIKSKEALLFEANETEKLIMPHIYSIGEIDKTLFQRNTNDLKKEGLLEKEIDFDNLIYEYKKEEDFKLNFTPDQIEYINSKKEITMCIDPDWMPYEKLLKNGKHIGMTSDYIPILSNKIGIPIKLIPTKNWSESIEFAKKRKCDIFSLAMQTESRLEYMKFTKPYISFPTVIATKNDKLFISNPEDIISKEKIGIVKGYAIGEILKRTYPNNKIVDVPSVDVGMDMVQSEEIFGFLGALPTVAYSLQHKYISELKIAGKFNDNLELGIGVRNDEPILFELFEKAISSLDEAKKQEILNKYISVKIQSEFNYKLFYQILFVVVVILLFGLFRHRQILKYNKILEKQRKELQSTQKKLRSSIKNIQTLLNATIEALFVFEDRVCIDVNSVGTKMFGYKDKNELIGKHIKEFVSSEYLEKIIKKIKDNDSSQYEIRAIKKNGDTFEVLVKGTNTIINGKNVRIAAVVDITEMKSKDKLLFQQSKMASMGEMLENIAHQWRQPLSLISTASTGLQIQKELGLSSNDDELKGLKKINDTAQYLSQTIEDFRDFFSPDKEIHNFSVLEVIKKNLGLFDAMFKSNGIEIVFDNNDDIFINNYENELAQALVNIFSNSRDAMQKITSEKYIFINLEKEENLVVISIKDNAGGIDEKIISNIFEPYFTTKHQSQGTGIGLYMTHQIIEKHMNGLINVKNSTYSYNNKDYTGAEFKIKLPL